VPSVEREVKSRRGVITEFSPKSRRRMLNSLAIINQDQAGLPSFLSPTYPDEVLPVTEKQVKRDLGVLRMAFLRRYGAHPVLWRREMKARKSGLRKGEWAPHLHLLIWGVEPTLEDRQWFADTWVRITGGEGQVWESKQHAVAVHPKSWLMPDSWRGTLAYVSKYCAKVAEGPGFGRSWGYWRRELLPVKLVSEEIPQDSRYAVRRVLASYIRRKSGRRVKLYSRSQGLSAFLSQSTGEKLVAWAWRDAGWKVEDGA
jgi:hypothetical protein